ncbi:MAG TPA: sugar transferase [Mucilaginibacter sp.]|jgi:undecaprenyl phosphate N,N'-diacetylbacillosamine 1-phosphate transferase|nr:sugar transferase [Mucilaginibacter sp.]
MIYNRIFKRVFDFILSFILFVALCPLFFIVIVLLLIANNGRVFFCQPRPGRKEQIFKVIKFKTMNDRKDSDGSLLPDAERLTTIGKFVRRTSLDEIPQLLNVIKGDMSLVGPRPLLVEYLPLYNEVQRHRHDVRPGITGWAQINGRNAISWAEKFEYDIWYVNHQTFLIDLKILWLTIARVFKSEGINQAGHVTMDRFKGNL